MDLTVKNPQKAFMAGKNSQGLARAQKATSGPLGVRQRRRQPKAPGSQLVAPILGL